jgi:hypothetical protein
MSLALTCLTACNIPASPAGTPTAEVSTPTSQPRPSTTTESSSHAVPTIAFPASTSITEPASTDTTQENADTGSHALGLEVSASGFTSITNPDSEDVTWGVVIRNPNLGDYATNTTIQVDLLDESGRVVASVHDSIGGITAGGTGAVAGLLEDVPKARSMQIEQHVGHWEGSAAPNFSAGLDSRHPYHEGDRTVSLRVSNPFTSGMSMVRLVTIFHDGAGQVVGGNATIIGCVPNTQALVQVPVPVDLQVASVNGYASWTADSRFGFESGC